ncbi:hypothetical protein P7C70_g1644, partial [Phenoliferia sp. Uapishka_3]
MTQRHLSTPASTPAAEPTVLFEAVHSLRKLTLNRPRVQNALNEDMVNLIQPQLQKWNESPLANVILLKGTGKSFCAGGDVKALVQQLDDKATWHKSSEFFQKEYATDAYIAKMKKPVVAIMHGNTLGGGLGLSMHAPFRIATETTQIAMPETEIGLFPDVGANFFLSRLDGQLGVYLGLTGERVRGAGALLSGFASHYVPAERLEALEIRLSELDQTASVEDVNAAIDEFAADAADLKAALASYTLVGAKRRAIDVIFASDNAEEIVDKLRKLEEGTLSLKKIVMKGEELEGEALKAWALETREKLEKFSPTSVKLALQAIKEGKGLDIEEAFLVDMRLATACCNPEVHPDFKTGVTSKLINKSADRPEWSPSTLSAVTSSSILKTFFSSPPPFKTPPIPSISFKVPGGPAYKSYPHARFSLPSEEEIRGFVTGEAKGSGDHALTRADLINKVGTSRGGKVGVREKVDEVIRRRCIVQEDGYLKWRY